MTWLWASFIGIAINIWRDTYGTGGGPFTPPVTSTLLKDRFNAQIFDRAGNALNTRVAS